MNVVFRPLLRKTVLVFFDDILIYIKSMTDHIEHVNEVFDLILKLQLYVKMSKCAFGVPKVEYIGYFISAKGVSTDPKRSLQCLIGFV